jgi:flagellar FliL protein
VTTTPTRSVAPAVAAAPGAKAAPAEKKNSLLKSKKFIIIVVAVLGVGGGAYKFLVPTKVPPPSGGDIVSLTANTLNLAGGHYLKIAVDVQLVKGKASVTSFQVSQAEELVINEFSDRTVASLSTNAARLALTAQLEAAIKQAYPGEVFDIFLTQFVTQ